MLIAKVDEAVKRGMLPVDAGILKARLYTEKAGIVNGAERDTALQEAEAAISAAEKAKTELSSLSKKGSVDEAIRSTRDRMEAVKAGPTTFAADDSIVSHEKVMTARDDAHGRVASQNSTPFGEGRRIEYKDASGKVIGIRIELGNIIREEWIDSNLKLGGGGAGSIRRGTAQDGADEGKLIITIVHNGDEAIRAHEISEAGKLKLKQVVADGKIHGVTQEWLDRVNNISAHDLATPSPVERVEGKTQGELEVPKAQAPPEDNFKTPRAFAAGDRVLTPVPNQPQVISENALKSSEEKLTADRILEKLYGPPGADVLEKARERLNIERWAIATPEERDALLERNYQRIVAKQFKPLATSDKDFQRYVRESLEESGIFGSRELEGDEAKLTGQERADAIQRKVDAVKAKVDTIMKLLTDNGYFVEGTDIPGKTLELTGLQKALDEMGVSETPEKIRDDNYYKVHKWSGERKEFEKAVFEKDGQVPKNEEVTDSDSGDDYINKIARNGLRQMRRDFERGQKKKKEANPNYKPLSFEYRKGQLALLREVVAYTLDYEPGKGQPFKIAVISMNMSDGKSAMTESLLPVIAETTGRKICLVVEDSGISKFEKEGAPKGFYRPKGIENGRVNLDPKDDKPAEGRVLVLKQVEKRTIDLYIKDKKEPNENILKDYVCFVDEIQKDVTDPALVFGKGEGWRVNGLRKHEKIMRETISIWYLARR